MKSRSLKKLLLLPVAGAFMVCASCSEFEHQQAPALRPIVTDTTPIGDGLKVIGFALVGVAVVAVLGRIIH